MAKLKEARGRGNQGDWQKPVDTDRYGTDPKHLEHNREVEAKRQAKLFARRKARG